MEFKMDLISVCKKLVLLFLIFALVHDDFNNQAQAWRPQGRFGKRKIDTSAAIEEQSLLENSSPYGLTDDNLSDPGLPLFRYGNIVCVRKGAVGIYRCLRWQGAEQEGLPSK